MESETDWAYDLLFCHWKQEEGRKDYAVEVGNRAAHQHLKNRLQLQKKLLKMVAWYFFFISQKIKTHSK